MFVEPIITYTVPGPAHTVGVLLALPRRPDTVKTSAEVTRPITDSHWRTAPVEVFPMSLLIQYTRWPGTDWVATWTIHGIGVCRLGKAADCVRPEIDKGMFSLSDALFDEVPDWVAELLETLHPGRRSCSS